MADGALGRHGFGWRQPSPRTFSHKCEREAPAPLEAHFAGSEAPVPSPTPLASLTASPEFEDGVWMLFDIDLSKLGSRAVRLNISLPERLLQQIDEAARRRRLARSAFLALAAEHEMARA